MIKIKNLTLKNDLLLAPLAGVSDLPFRTLCEEYGAALTFTEMISAKGLMYDNKKTKDMLTTTKKGLKGLQIFGSDPKIMGQVVKTYKEIQDFDLIDINMGCPVNKVIKNGEGSALMKNPSLAFDIIKEVVNSTDKPVSVKFRKGFDSEHINAIEFAKICEEAGASLITIHGRTREQMYSGKVDLEIIKKVKDSVSIPVIGNGDVFDRESYLKMKETGCDGVMIARGSLGRPYIFSEIIDETFIPNKKETILKHISLCQENYSNELYSVKNLRKHLLWYLKGEKDGKIFKDKVTKCTTYVELISLVNEAFHD